MRFFYPLPNFWDWLVAESKPFKCIVEIGCGDGDLLREMRLRGLPVMGVDNRYILFETPVPPDLCSCLLSMSVEECDFIHIPDLFLLVCRPCHSGFAGNVNTLRHPTSVYYYVGFRRNLRLDLGDGVKTRCVLENVGQEQENLYLVYK